MKDLSVPKISPFDFSNNDLFQRRCENSAWHGTKSMSYLGQKILHFVSNEIKQSETANAFKLRIKDWIPERYPYRIWKVYLGQVGFIFT